jgi:hypothetical protein
MKVVSLASLALFVATASAQYFSEGWSPGQKASPTHEFAPEFTPVEGDAAATQPEAKAGFMDALAQGPLGSILAKAGMNLTASLEAAKAAELELWDNRIPFIHDDNYDELIVQEPLTAEEEQDRTWFLIMYVSFHFGFPFTG